MTVTKVAVFDNSEMGKEGVMHGKAFAGVDDLLLILPPGESLVLIKTRSGLEVHGEPWKTDTNYGLHSFNCLLAGAMSLNHKHPDRVIGLTRWR